MWTYETAMASFRKIQEPIDRYIFLLDLLDAFPGVYYALLLKHTEEVRTNAYRHVDWRVHMLLSPARLWSWRPGPLSTAFASLEVHHVLKAVLLFCTCCFVMITLLCHQRCLLNMYGCGLFAWEQH